MFYFKRNFCSRHKVCLVDPVMKSVTNNEYKPRKHPGVIQLKTISLPEEFLKATEKILGDYPVKTLWNSSQKMNRYLKERLPPMENKEIQKVMQESQEKVISTIKDVTINNENDDIRAKQSIKDKTRNVMRERIYNWQAIKYDVNTSLTYLLARSAQEYAVLLRIMLEIKSRDPNFKPRSLFDFGSGVGIGTWAAISFWKKDIFEYFNVDISKDMNDLAQLLLQGGHATGKRVINGVFYRQFLPVSRNSYDLVICSYTLLELPSVRSRMETILNLWNKTENYLIVVEHGNKGGFQIINEIRDFVLQLNDGCSGGYIFSPCPHDYVCPKIVNEKQTICKFPVKYYLLPFHNKKQVNHELYSYVVFKKGKRNSDILEWPRIVEPVLVRSQHSICRMCTNKGKLKEVIFTAYKHGKPLYYCARNSNWGDSLPIAMENDEEKVLHNTDVDSKM